MFRADTHVATHSIRYSDSIRTRRPAWLLTDVVGMNKLIVSCVGVAFSVLGWCAAVGARGQQAPGILIDSLAGKDSFDRYCAACHGTNARGNGALATELRTPPADLTLLARQNNGAFPREAVRDFITGLGRTPTAHGTAEMPVWGPMFRAFESDARVRERISNLVTYIETLQQPSTGPDDTGSRLFRAHCASCHGSDARGAGPIAAHMRRAPSDLTRYTQRNGGVFPSERVYRIIEGRDLPAHGDRDMPVWGEAFKLLPGSDQAAVKARIEAIVRYLQGIQERSL
jgi:mono/diheme cytochrome c family protein